MRNVLFYVYLEGINFLVYFAKISLKNQALWRT
jgi:hypothetical protein